MNRYERITLDNLTRLPEDFAVNNRDILQEIDLLQAEIKEAHEWIKAETRTCIVGAENRNQHYKTIKYNLQDIEWQLNILNERRKECVNW